LKLLIRILATWRLASLLHSEEGPFEVFAQLRDVAGVRYDEHSKPVSDNQIGKMLSCFWCTSVWAAAIVGVLQGELNVLHILSDSAGAILIEQVREHGAR
jgi:hypothetical protein